MASGTKQEAAFNFYEAERLDPPFSHLGVLLYLFCLTVVLARGLRALLAEWRMLRLAKRADVGRLGEGTGATILKGQVVFAQGESLAMRTVIEQEGVNLKDKQGACHRWQETSRHTKARPFYIQCEDGQRIRIEPSERTFFVAATQAPRWQQANRRTITADLLEETVVFVEGVPRLLPDPERAETAVGYRQKPLGWVMRHASPEPLKISAEPLAERHRWKVSQIMNEYRFALLWGLVTLLFAVPYAMCLVTGVECRGQVVSTSRQRRKTKNHYRTTYKVRYTFIRPQAALATQDTAEITRSDYQLLEVERPKRKVDIVVRSYVGVFGPTSQLGRGTSIHGMLVVAMFFVGLLVYSFVHSSLNVSRWYESKLNHFGRGSLPGPPEALSAQGASSEAEKS